MLVFCPKCIGIAKYLGIAYHHYEFKACYVCESKDESQKNCCNFVIKRNADIKEMLEIIEEDYMKEILGYRIKCKYYKNHSSITYTGHEYDRVSIRSIPKMEKKSVVFSCRNHIINKNNTTEFHINFNLQELKLRKLLKKHDEKLYKALLYIYKKDEYDFKTKKDKDEESLKRLIKINLSGSIIAEIFHISAQTISNKRRAFKKDLKFKASCEISKIETIILDRDSIFDSMVKVKHQYYEKLIK